mgnify:CR=1 FL=1
MTTHRTCFRLASATLALTLLGACAWLAPAPTLDPTVFPQIDRAECIRQMLSRYDDDWQLYYIGSPTEAFVPITFVKKGDMALQRRLMLGELA